MAKNSRRLMSLLPMAILPQRFDRRHARLNGSAEPFMTTGTQLLSFDVGGLHDWPPLVGLGFLVTGKELSCLLIAWRVGLAKSMTCLTHGGVAQQLLRRRDGADEDV